MRTCKFIFCILIVFLFLSNCGDSHSYHSKVNNKITAQGDETSGRDVIKLEKLKGDEIGISTASGEQQNPHAVFISNKGVYLVVWEDWRNNSTGVDIYGRFIKGDGSECGDEFIISNAPGNQTVPRVAYRNGDIVGESGVYKVVVVWQDTRYTENFSGFVYYKPIDVSSLDAECSNPLPGVEGAIRLIDEVPDDPPLENIETTSRVMPKITFDPVKDRFLIVWVESNTTRKTSKFRPFGANLSEPMWTFGDTQFIGYAALRGDLNDYNVIPTIISQWLDTCTACDVYTRARLISRSSGAYEVVSSFEFFDQVTSVDVSCDETTQECLILWEGVKGTFTRTDSCADDPGEDPSNGICDNNDLVATAAETEYDPTQKQIFGIFEKNILLSSVNSLRISNSSTDTYYPSISFDPIHRKFFATWEDLRDGSDTKIYGQLIYSGSGLYNTNFLISFQDTNGDDEQDQNVANSRQTRPFISYDSVNQRFFVIWQDGRNQSQSLENLDIYGQYVDSEGTLRGSNYSISTSTSNQLSPVISYDNNLNQFLTVWKDARNADKSTCGPENNKSCGSDIYGQRFTIGNPQLILLKLDDTPLAPALLNFGSVTTGQSSALSFKIKNSGDTTLGIDCVDPFTGDIPFSHENLPTELNLCHDGTTLNLVPSAETTLTVKFAPTIPGTFTGNFTIRSDGGDRTVSVQGSGISPSLTIQEGDGSDDGVLNFGTIKVGQTNDLTLTMINNGTIEYNITSITGIKQPFSIIEGLNYPVLMSAGSRETITIRFNPLERGTFTGQLLINTDKPGLNRTVNLSGQAVAPVLRVVPISLDFGVVDVGSLLDIDITIYNDGDDTLNITSCGTPPAGFSIDTCPLSINKGLSEKMTVTFSPTGLASYTGSLNIQTNAGNQEVNLSGQGSGSKLEVLPIQIDFGSIEVGLPKIKSLTVTNSGTKAMNITVISGPTNPEFSLSYTGMLPIKLLPGTSFIINVRFEPTAVGIFSGSFMIQSDADINSDQTINLQGIGAVSDIEISNSLNFGDVRVGQSSDLSLTITNSGISALDITNITGVDDPFKIPNPPIYPYTLSAGASLNLMVRFSPTTGGNFTGQMIIQTDKAGVREVVSLSGTGIAPNLWVDETELKFGTVSAGTTSDLTVTLKNTGTNTLTIDSLTTTNPRFSIVSPPVLPLTIVPGGTKTLTVRFSPIDIVSYSGNLLIVSDGGNQSISLIGNGSGGKIEVAPSQIDFGTVGVGSTKTVSLIVNNIGTKAMNITAISTPTEQDFSLYYIGLPPINLLPGTGFVINVKFTPKGTGTYSDSFIISTDAVNGDQTINLQGVGVSPDIDVSNSLSYGSVKVGQSSDLPLTITNSGTSGLNIINIAGVEAPFEILNPPMYPYTLSAGASLDLIVRFKPTTGDSFTGQMIIQTNIVGVSEVIVLTGTGIASKILVDKTKIDFGTVSVGSSSDFPVTLSNRGTGPLTVSSLTTTDPAFSIISTPFLPLTIAPGDTKVITINFHPTDIESYNGNLLIVSDGGDQSVILVGEGAGSKIEVSPHQIDFGTVGKGSTKTVSLKVTNAGNAAMNITAIDTPLNPDFSLNYTGTSPIKLLPGTSFTINVKFEPTSVRTYSDSFTISTNATNGNQTINLQGASLEIDIRYPLSVDFGSVTINSSASHKIEIKNNSTLDVEILGFDLPQSPFTLLSPPDTPYTLRAGETVSIISTFSPTNPVTYSSTLGVLFGHDTSSKLIALNGQGTSDISGAGELVFTGDSGLQIPSYHFGNVLTGGQTQRTIRLKNRGSSTVTIASVSTSSQNFQPIVSVPFDLAPDSARDINVIFSPSVTTSYKRTLSVMDSDGNTYTLSLTGNGVHVVISSNATTLDYTELNVGSLAGVPSDFAPEKSVKFVASGVDSADIVMAFKSLPSNAVIYKVVDGTWIQIYPINKSNGISKLSLSGNVLSFTIADNSDCDGDSRDNEIYDPVVIGMGISTDITGTNPPPSTPTGGGGGCTVTSTPRNAQTAVIDMLMFILPVVIFGWLKGRKK